ncbi:MAG: hypothetical protein HQL10_03415 [Nitrospirae bacterium]|nr:hypothetical protein [Nitrospirota bacterium]
MSGREKISEDIRGIENKSTTNNSKEESNANIERFISDFVAANPGLNKRIELGEALYANNYTSHARRVIKDVVDGSLTRLEQLEIDAFELLRIIYRQENNLAEYDNIISALPDGYPQRDFILKEAVVAYYKEGDREGGRRFAARIFDAERDNVYLRYYINGLAIEDRDLVSK